MRPSRFAFLAPLLLLAGCVSADEPATPASVADPAVASEGAAATRFEGTSHLSAVACAPLPGGACAIYGINDDEGFKLTQSAASARLEVTWTAGSPLQEELKVNVRFGDETIATASGASPLVLEWSPLEPGEYTVVPFDDGGAAIEQDVAWVVDVAYGNATA